MVKSGDLFLLCSDGLTDMLDDVAISELLAQGADASVLCSAAIEAGGSTMSPVV
jgi:protein phosphatase